MFARFFMRKNKNISNIFLAVLLIIDTTNSTYTRTLSLYSIYHDMILEDER